MNSPINLFSQETVTLKEMIKNDPYLSEVSKEKLLLKIAEDDVEIRKMENEKVLQSKIAYDDFLNYDNEKKVKLNSKTKQTILTGSGSITIEHDRTDRRFQDILIFLCVLGILLSLFFITFF